MNIYALAADALLALHTLFVVFVVTGLVLVVIGGLRNWKWVRYPWFRLVHLGAIGFVVVQAWAGQICPLTVWENLLRHRAGELGYTGSFIGHWLERLLYYDAPTWVFTSAYTLFGALVIASWVLVKPHFRGGTSTPEQSASQGGNSAGNPAHPHRTGNR
mgnify:FL=1